MIVPNFKVVTLLYWKLESFKHVVKLDDGWSLHTAMMMTDNSDTESRLGVGILVPLHCGSSIHLFPMNTVADISIMAVASLFHMLVAAIYTLRVAQNTHQLRSKL